MYVTAQVYGQDGTTGSGCRISVCHHSSAWYPFTMILPASPCEGQVPSGEYTKLVAMWRYMAYQNHFDGALGEAAFDGARGVEILDITGAFGLAQ